MVNRISVVLMFFVAAVFAIYGGIPDGNIHAYQGVVLLPDTWAAQGCQSSNIAYIGCGASLIQGLGLPERRVAVTAAHCLIRTGSDLGRPILMTFDEKPGWVFDYTCQRPRFPVDMVQNASYTYFTSRNVWIADPVLTNVGMPGEAKKDYAILLLDEAVPESVVPVPLKIALTDALRLNQLLVVGMAGHGTVGWGDRKNNTLGNPINYVGPRHRRYIEMDTLSIQPTNIVTRMSVASGDSTACNGDSGSAAIEPAPDATGAYIAHGVVSAGDAQCRGINTFTRIDTHAFHEWIASIRDSVLELAA